MDAELKAILDALLEGQRVLSAKLDGVDARLSSVEVKVEGITSDLQTIKGQLSQMNARDQFILHKLAEVEADVHILKQAAAADPEPNNGSPTER